MNLPGTPKAPPYETIARVEQSTPELSIRCRDIGMDCSFEATAEADHKLMRKFIEHAESSHNMPVLSADLLLKVKKAMKK